MSALNRKKATTCLLFTQNFPYGNSEIFIERELPYLCKRFVRVLIFPMDVLPGQVRSLPENSEYHFLFSQTLSKSEKLKALLSSCLVLTNLILMEFFHHPFLTLKNLRTIFSESITLVAKAKLFKRFCKTNNISNKSVFYSYWFDRWATVLAILKIGNLTVARAHAFDLYEEDNRDGIIVNRKFQLKHLNHIYTVSQQGSVYLKKKYPQFESKISHAYLGTIMHSETNPINNQISKTTIISSGLIQERKRMHLIPEILNFLPEDFNWVHFGGGSDLESLEKVVKKCGVEKRVLLLGHVENDEFHKYLRDQPVFIFLSLSRNEGLPYSMMEAISYGIPLMSTDVGGCSEICNEKTGILIPKDFDVKEVAKQIAAFSASNMNTPEFRKGVRKFWEENFNAEKNYNQFYKEISLS